MVVVVNCFDEDRREAVERSSSSSSSEVDESESARFVVVGISVPSLFFLYPPPFRFTFARSQFRPVLFLLLLLLLLHLFFSPLTKGWRVKRESKRDVDEHQRPTAAGLCCERTRHFWLTMSTVGHNLQVDPAREKTVFCLSIVPLFHLFSLFLSVSLSRSRSPLPCRFSTFVILCLYSSSSFSFRLLPPSTRSCTVLFLLFHRFLSLSFSLSISIDFFPFALFYFRHLLLLFFFKLFLRVVLVLQSGRLTKRARSVLPWHEDYRADRKKRIRLEFSEEEHKSTLGINLSDRERRCCCRSRSFFHDSPRTCDVLARVCKSRYLRLEYQRTQIRCICTDTVKKQKFLCFPIFNCSI